jgi:hypothetical protein
MENNPKKEKFIFGAVLEAKDEIDKYILQEIVQLPIFLQAEQVVFFGRRKDDRSHEKHLSQMIDLGKFLTQTNDAIRSYEKVQKETIDSFKEEGLKNPNANTFLSKRSPGLNKEIEYFLYGIKSSLDQLAQILGLILNIKIDGWHKGTENGKELSGIKIIRALRKLLPEDEKRKERYEKLIDYIEINLEPLTYIVKLRDESHRSGLKNISDIIYDPETKKVHPQVISHSKEEAELVLGFMKRTMLEFNAFINSFIILSYMLNSPKDMVIQRRENPVSYNWAIVQRKMQTETGK